MDFLISTMAIHFYINPYVDDYVSFLQLKRIQVQHGYTILMVMPLLWIQFQGTHGFPFKGLDDTGSLLAEVTVQSNGKKMCFWADLTRPFLAPKMVATEGKIP